MHEGMKDLPFNFKSAPALSIFGWFREVMREVYHSRCSSGVVYASFLLSALSACRKYDPRKNYDFLLYPSSNFFFEKNLLVYDLYSTIIHVYQ